MEPDKIYRSLVDRGSDWCDKHAAAELLESALKSLQAQLTIEAKGVESCSMAESKELALSSNTYRDAAVASIKARQEANRAKVVYDSTKILFDAQRTVEASHRAAAKAAT
jgi:hypothetical protein